MNKTNKIIIISLGIISIGAITYFLVKKKSKKNDINTQSSPVKTNNEEENVDIYKKIEINLRKVQSGSVLKKDIDLKKTLNKLGFKENKDLMYLDKILDVLNKPDFPKTVKNENEYLDYMKRNNLDGFEAKKIINKLSDIIQVANNNGELPERLKKKI